MVIKHVSLTSSRAATYMYTVGSGVRDFPNNKEYGP